MPPATRSRALINAPIASFSSETSKKRGRPQESSIIQTEKKSRTKAPKTPKSPQKTKNSPVKKSPPLECDIPEFKNSLDRTLEFELLPEPLTKDSIFVGVDEAGRGPLAGPVVAAACYIPPGVFIEGVDDSKKLTEDQREFLFARLTKNPHIRYSVAIVEKNIIDEINILEATMRAMSSCVHNFPIPVEFALIDGNRIPKDLPKSCGAAFLIGGDAKSFSIAAASIIAKCTRDRIMRSLDEEYPGYGFAVHKGYGTASHVAAIFKLGPSPVHRESFNPVKSILINQQKTKQQEKTEKKTTKAKSTKGKK